MTTALSVAAALFTAEVVHAQTPPPIRPITVPATPNPRPRAQLIPADAPPPPTAIAAKPPPSQVLVFEKTAGSDTASTGGLPGLAVPQAPNPAAPPPTPAPKEQPAPTPKAGVPTPMKDPDKEPKPMLPSAEVPPCLPTTKPFKLEAQADLMKRLTNELIEEERARNLRTGSPNWTPKAEYYQSPPATRLLGCEGPHVAKTVNYPPQTKYIEPGYVVHRKLHFEELNSERHGWEFGIAQPMVSTLFFYKDVLLWPASLTSNLRERYDTSAGKCPPGSPYPYSLYPPGYTLFGLSTEASMIIGAAFIFP